MLKTFSEEAKKQHIEQHLGMETLKKLQHIHRGGENANKGQKYEDLFMLFKVLEIASSKADWEFHRFSHQNLDFFDDICYEDFETETKHNYQAKNALHDTANWNDIHEERARKQIEIDLGFHKAKQSHNYFVVSCENKHKQNKRKIPKDLNKNCFSVYFPYYQNNFAHFVSEILSEPLALLIESKNQAEQDYAAKLLLGILSSSDKPRTLDEIFSEAEVEGKPNPFSNPMRRNILPSWMSELLLKHQSLQKKIQSNDLIVSHKDGFQTKVPIETIKALNDDSIKQLNTLSSIELLLYLMRMTAKCLNGEGIQ